MPGLSSAHMAEPFLDVRSQLLQALKGSGTFDDLKTQVRCYLLAEIRSNGPAKAQPQPPRELPLVQRAASSLVLRHLRASGCAYSLSVFSSESGLGGVPLEPHDICDILRLPRSALAPAPAVAGGEGDSELVRALGAVGRLLPSGRESTATQTGGGSSPEELESRLRAVDRGLEASLLRAAEGAEPAAELEGRLLRYQREADARAAAQVAAEVARVRQVELAQVRLSEAAKARAEVQRVVAQQQEWHAAQLARFKAQEAAAAEAARQREAAFERSLLRAVAEESES